MKYVLSMALCGLVNTAHAQEAIDSAERVLILISDFANRMCSNPEYKGSSLSVGADAKVAADVSKLLKNIANVSLQLGANAKNDSFVGLAQKDLVEATKNATECRLKIVDLLSGHLLVKPAVPKAGRGAGYKRPVHEVSPHKSNLPFDPALLTAGKQKTVLAARGQIERAEAAAAMARDAEQAAERAALSAHRGDPLTNIFEGTGIRYEGEWVNGQPSGFGKVQWSGVGSPSLGENFAGQMNGWVRIRGVFSYPPPINREHPYGGALRYEGEWAPTTKNRAGNWNGYGKVLYRDGSVYRGQLVDGDFEGYGTLFRPDTSRIEGKWKGSSPVADESVQWKAGGTLVD